MFTFQTPFLSRFSRKSVIPDDFNAGVSALPNPSSAYERLYQCSNNLLVLINDWANDSFNYVLLDIVMPPVASNSAGGSHTCSTNCDKALEVFKKKFALPEIRHNQRDIIKTTMAGEHCIVVMPTEGGKSLCFQLPAVERPGVTIVVSPLKSLMVDQIARLSTLGIRAVFLVAGSTRHLHQRCPRIRLVYITPEMLIMNKSFRITLMALSRHSNLVRFVIDKAHCMTQWGLDFRPTYRKLWHLQLVQLKRL